MIRAMTTMMKIDFVSDVACPWCAVGLNALERALESLQGDPAFTAEVAIELQPFELNPQMPPEGEDTTQHLSRKYGIDAAQIARNQEALRQRGAAVGFEFGVGKRTRIYNTFDAHRLLMWAAEAGPADSQRRLKHALLAAYHTHGDNPGATEVLVKAAAESGLDADAARAVLASTRYTDEVREREQMYQGLGIHSVPSVIINNRHLITGGQPPEVFAAALKQIAAQG
jgi:predicted DsbA family dithiol-disulfide isomerase